MRPCHDGCSALSSLEVMLRDGESRPQLCVHHREQSARVKEDAGDSLIFHQRVGTHYERTQEDAGRFRRVLVSWRIAGWRVPATHEQVSAATGMVTGWRLTDA